MQTIFYIKNAKANANANNSVILRFKLAETGRYKVKGLKISCTLKEWNQDDQIVRRSNAQYKKYNDKLAFITKELEKIDNVRVVTAEDIDVIVKASIEGLTVEELKNKVDELKNKEILLTKILDDIYKERLSNKAYSQNTITKFNQLKGVIEKFEASVGYKITMNALNDGVLKIQRDLIKYFRDLGVKDSSIKEYLKVLNTAIRENTDLTGNETKTFNFKKFKTVKAENQIIALNIKELEKLYEFVFNPSSPTDIHTSRFELRNLKLFLFRCFSGMRISDMNKKNINPTRLTATSKTFTYFQKKGAKTATVLCIDSYLFDIAESLDWDFPEFKTADSLRSYGRRETAAVRKHLSYLLKGNERQIADTTKEGFVYTNLSEAVTTHTARKTFAHLIYNLSGNNILLVMNQLGHTTVQITKQYLGIDLNEITEDFKNVNLGF
tara:strand:+ start:737 stop:2053 length:1317 start_codon:yes stop_codon:yes gene_type:complete